MSKDYYKTLGVDKNASQDEIKKAFRKKAHEFHPDKKGGDEAKFKEVNEAYQILGNAEKKKQYDQFGDAAFSGQGFGGTGMNWEDFSRAASQGGFSGNTGGFNINIDDLGDIFGDIGDMFGFGGNRRNNRRARGADIQTEIIIDFKEAVFGVEKELRLHKTITCKKCNGNKAEPGTPIETCKTCGGQGIITQVQRTILGSFQSRSTCPDCGGEGKTAKTKCSQCRGTGLQKDTVEINVKIPAGIDDGQTIRLSGHGETSGSGSNGDLYITVRVRTDKNFERDGEDILSSAEISFSQAALGDKISVITVDGEITLKIPAGTQSGQVFKLRGRGAYSLHGRNRGDHLVTVNIKTPVRLNREE
ncbi:MAG: molecular chaperone DnaJ, partial [Candidatus Omnitrophica bacterium CG1_02_46_14]